MPGKKAAPARTLLPIRKSPTGIRGLDEISGGGLPKGRTTIVCGGAGGGQNILGVWFLFRRGPEYCETRVLIALSENPPYIAQKLPPLGFAISGLLATEETVPRYS